MVLFRTSAITRTYLSAYRTFSTTNKKQFAELIKTLPRPHPKVPHPEHVAGIALWKKLTFFAAVPAVLLITGSVAFLDDHHPKRPEFIPYEYMRRRIKVNSLLANLVERKSILISETTMG